MLIAESLYMKNKEIAEALYRISELLTLKNVNVFKVRAYERASEILSALPEPIEDIGEKQKLTDIPGIGESIAEKITEHLKTGKIAYLEELKKSFPEGLFEIMKVQGMGPKKAKALFDKLKVKDIAELKKAAGQGKVSVIKGFGKKSEENILKGIASKEKYSTGRVLLSEALSLYREIKASLTKHKFIKRISPAGSLRRYRETIGDIDILCTTQKGKEKAAAEYFTKLPFVSRVTAAGPTKASVLTKTGMQVDLRVVDESQYGSALQYFTGSKEHNILMRGLARDMGLTVNEYGVFKIGKEDKTIASRTEEDVYEALKLAYVPPELRENRGELEAAKNGTLPELLELSQIKGDTHCHSKFSDGADTLEDIARKAQSRGYEWLVVTDHSRSLKVARGLEIPDLKLKIKEVARINEKLSGFRLLCGTEADILADGSIDYPDEILKQLDFVIASVHTGFNQSENQLTGRVLKALENPYVCCIGHPTGRLLNKREPYAINIDKVIAAAKKHGKLLEINSFPDRLDLNDIYCRKAKDAGVKIAIGTDSHSVEHLSYMELGVSVARRGWLEKDDVINTLSYEKLIKTLNKFNK